MKKINLYIIVFLCLLTLVGGTLAYFGSTTVLENEFQSGKYKAVTEEEFVSPTNWLPGQTIPKTITTTNEGTIPVRVRVKFEESWTSKNGNPLELTYNDENVAIINLSNDLYWDYVDGYYYYIEELMPGNSAASLIGGVTFNENTPSDVNCSNVDGVYTCESTGNGYDDATYKLKIITETVQSDAVLSAWNLDTDPITPTYYYSSFNDSLLQAIASGERVSSIRTMFLNKSLNYLLDNTEHFENYEDLGSDIFFIHTVRNGIVRMESIGFIYNDNLYVLNYGGEIPYEYNELDGQYIYHAEENNMFLRNKSVLINAFGSENCLEQEENISVNVDNYRIILDFEGKIEVSLYNPSNYLNFCYIYPDGAIFGASEEVAGIDPPNQPVSG